MKESTAKEKVLKRVRNALINPAATPATDIDQESPIYAKAEEESLDILFAENFSKIGGKFIFCENTSELTDTLRDMIEEFGWGNLFCLDESIKSLLRANDIEFKDKAADFDSMDAGITYCESLIARTGSILVSSKLHSGRRLSVYPPVHIVIAYTRQLVYDIKDALNEAKNKYGNKTPSLISLITGPSRTADIEKTLVMGAHGPKEIYLFLIDN